MLHGNAFVALIATGLLMIAPELSAQSVAKHSPTAASETPGRHSSQFASKIRPLLSTYCFGCHGATKPKAGLDLTALLDEAKSAQNRRLWIRVKENVESGLMPPEERPQPARGAVEALADWVETELTKADCGRNVDPGRVTIRRLNRVEYNNTIRDLVGVDFRPADDFPSDDVGYGFDNIGDVLTLPPILMEKYLAAAEAISEQAIVAGGSVRSPVRSWEAQTLDPAAGGQTCEDARILTSTGEIAVDHAFPRDGDYILRARACGDQAGPEPVRMAFLVDGKTLKTFDVSATRGAARTYEWKEKLRGGNRRFAVAFLNDYYNPDERDASRRDRNLLIESLEVEGPIRTAGDPLPESHRKIVFRSPRKPEDSSECASAVVQQFATRAYRRPVTGGEVAKLLRFVDLARENGDSFERGIQLAVQAALVSPQFLFRVELNRGRRKSSDKERAGNNFPFCFRYTLRPVKRSAAPGGCYGQLYAGGRAGDDPIVRFLE